MVVWFPARPARRFLSQTAKDAIACGAFCIVVIALAWSAGLALYQEPVPEPMDAPAVMLDE